MKKILMMLLCMSLLLMTGCQKDEPAKELTVGEVISETFKNEVKNTKDVNDLSEKISDALMNASSPKEEEQIRMISMEVTEGYLNGFSGEINGFTSGSVFAPMIGSIPLIGYVFVSDDAKALTDLLKEKADLRWNVCTEADEMITLTEGNVVLFAMCPKSFEE